MKCKCPSCGVKFKVKTKVTLIPKPDRAPALKLSKAPVAKKYRTNTDVGAFRQALHDAGFTDEADNIIFNDKRQNSRRLKLWFGRNVFDASAAKQRKLAAALSRHFGNRLVETSADTGKGPGGRTFSFIVRLKF